MDKKKDDDREEIREYNARKPGDYNKMRGKKTG